MAKASQSKSDLIRNILDKGIKSPKEVIEAVKAEYNVEVKTGLVSAVKAKHKAPKAARKPRRAAAASTNGTGKSPFMSQLKQAVELLGHDAVIALVKTV